MSILLFYFIATVPVLAYQKEVSRALVEITLFFLEREAVSCSAIILLHQVEQTDFRGS